jgi:hypothetical protein
VFQSFKNNVKRCPAFAIWGLDRMDERGRTRGNTELQKKVNPHVIFQFSWASALIYEKHTINDMLLFAGVSDYIDLGRPNVMYLIKAK